MSKGLLNTTYIRKCPMCEETTSMDIEDYETNKAIQEWEKGNIFLQDIPLPPNKREFLKTGYCFECQKLLFGTE